MSASSLLCPRRRPSRNRRGSAILEATLTLPLFLLFVFSIVDFGITAFMHHTLMFRAREAARWGAVQNLASPGTITTIQNMILYGSTTPGTASIYDITASNITVSRMHAPTNEDRIVITISGFQFPLYTYLVAGLHPGSPISVSMPVEDHSTK